MMAFRQALALRKTPADVATRPYPDIPGDAAAMVEFWKESGPGLWFAKDTAFDERFRSRFLGLHEMAARDELADWADAPYGALALVLLLDQFPRNAFRGTPCMYTTDPLARYVATAAVDWGYDLAVEAALRVFFYLPFAHSEDMVDQDRSLRLSWHLGPPHSVRAQHHREIIQRFGRFPHRNAILGRPTTDEEQAFLDAGGFAG